ncbi:hypothetical protein Tco_0336583 [Tanacetum coccineum]
MRKQQVLDLVLGGNQRVEFSRLFVLDGFQQERHSPLAQQRYSLKYRPRSSMFKRRLIAADQASVFMAMTSDHNRSELGIQDHSNEQSSSKLVPKVVVRLGINPMIQPEPEDLPKDNPKLEIAVLSQDSVKFKTGLGFNATSSTTASPAVESFVNSFEMLKNQENNKSKSDKGYHAVPLPYIGDFMLCKPDLTFMDEIVKSENLDVTIVVTPSNVKAVELNHESANVKSNGDAVEPKTVRKNSFRPPVIMD